MRWHMKRLVPMLVLAGSCLAAQNAAPRDRVVGRYPDGRPIIMQSLGGDSSQAYVEGFIVRVAGSVRVPVGLERPRESGTVRSLMARDPVLLSGKTVDDALEAIVDAEALLKPPNAKRTHDRYRVSWTRGVAHVSAFVGRRTLLDTVVPSFSVRNLPLESAVQMLRATLNGAPRPLPPDLQRSPTGVPMEDTLFSKKSVTLTLAHATAREILDALVLANGAASWVVRYGVDPRDPKSTIFVLMSFDGQGIQVN